MLYVDDELGDSTSVWISYLETMAAFEAPLSYDIQFSLNYTTYGTPDYSTPVTTGAGAAALGIALGSQGLQASDLTAYPTGYCDNNSCNVFNAHHGAVPDEWQTVSLSDPTGTGSGNLCGSLVPLLPFALARGGQILEIYTADLLCTFDPTWSGTGNNTYSLCQTAGYAAAVKAAATALALRHSSASGSGSSVVSSFAPAK